MRKIYLTFDMDWASDEIMEYWLNLINKYDVSATINVTHTTKMLEKFRQNPRIECGIHPNFNVLLMNEEEGKKTYEDRIVELKRIVPEAVTCRSHCLTNSTLILKILEKYQIKYESNLYIPPQEGMKCTAIHMFDNLIRIPFIFEDDLYLEDCNKRTVDYYLSEVFDMPRVFNFHPIHLFLNSENIDRYVHAKLYNQNFEQLQLHRNLKEKCVYGVEDFFVELIKKAKVRQYEFKCLSEWETNDECKII